MQCPTYRADMELEADLIEEIARFYGYQNIPDDRARQHECRAAVASSSLRACNAGTMLLGHGLQRSASTSVLPLRQ